MGALGWLGQHMDLYTMPSDICLSLKVNGPKWRDGDLLHGTDMSQDVI